ncbi:hypothetical protein VUJ49_05285 [Pseudomonas berkeleyensis]|uniref:Uncharacterized protein n=1 Tax=Pseudomonas berkeleyensis TaxID=2726956 RepID=A0A7G5DRV4_9PSED|nr:hypothetical protein [Pseudomonas berkeleyensis]QMV64479.1 hypothetical protein HS968_05275 [Pseudomonas berkeleyensis]WSO39943.1 hypothetical protein VUJ49_05285 [Pseudomonas berkeleyensis]
MTYFYKCQSNHWCASDEKIIESEWGKAWCSFCKLKVIKSPPTAEPPNISEMPVVVVIESTDPIEIHGRLYRKKPVISGVPVEQAENFFAREILEFKEQDSRFSHEHVVLQECDSQGHLYVELKSAGFAFLARDLNFRDYKEGGVDIPDATIPEPGVMGANSYTARLVGEGDRHGIGRLEVVYGDGYFQKGLVTYPDYFVLRNRVIYAIELKTPREKSFKLYMSNSFWTDKKYGKQSIEDEISNRKGKMASTVMQVLLFDTRNMKVNNEQALIDMANSIGYLKERKSWFKTHINAVMFFNGTLSKLISIDEVISGEEGTGTQTNILSFFKKK